MDSRKLIIIIIISTLSFTVALLSMMIIKQEYPTWLGLPPNPQDTMTAADTVMIEKTFEITERRLDKMQRDIATVDSVKHLKDSLGKLVLELMAKDSNSQNTITKYKDSLLPKAISDLKNSQTYSEAVSSSMTRMKGELSQANNKAELALEQINSQSAIINQKSDSLKKENFKAFAKIYNNSKPAEVAKILERMDERDAAVILKLMSKKKAGKVIEAMEPERAAMINLLSGSK
jgi:flagellar motility protein MotE (MotC chaperone)